MAWLERARVSFGDIDACKEVARDLRVRATLNSLARDVDIEPWTYLTAAGLLTMIVVLASLAPAIRSTRMNLVEVLRAE